MLDVKEKTLLQTKTPHFSGHRKRLRQKLLTSPKGTLFDYEILETLLFAANPRKDVKPLAKDLLNSFGSLAAIINASVTQLKQVSGMNDTAIAAIKAVNETIDRVLKQQFAKEPILQSWKALLDYLRADMGFLNKEQFRVLYLNSKNILIKDELQDQGTVNKLAISVRNIIKKALEIEANAIVLAHNHPSGDVTPSQSDITTTKKIKEAANMVGITLFDHLIISKNGFYSFKNNGLI